MSTNERSFFELLWDFFCSLKLTISLLISLALTSIIGTVLPQGQLPPEYVAQVSQTKLQIYSKLGFFDMYHSWWFVALLYVFSLNLISCSIKRLPHVFKFITEPLKVMGETQRKTFPLSQDLKFSASLDTGRERLVEFLRTEFAGPVVTEDNGEYHIFAQKNPWCRLGVYVVHLSIIIIFIGAIIGSLFGYKGYVNITEGTSISSVDGRNGMPIPLGFSLRCDQFSRTDYPNGAPKEFKSILTVLENGQPVKDYTNVRIVVNEPLNYKGITFYQSSYGQANEGSSHYFSIGSRTGGGNEKYAVRQGEQIQLKDGSSFRLLDTASDYRQISPESGLSGPVARIELTQKGSAGRVFDVLRNHPEMSSLRGDELIVTYQGTDARMYTGLQVAKDPGVWVVWLGCTLMVIGLYIAFFLSHKRVWIVVVKGYARMYGNASKNHAAFQGEFEVLAEKLKDLKI